MMRLRELLTLTFLALGASAAMSQEEKGSHKPIDDWNRGGVGPVRASEMAERLKAAGINPPPAGQVEPEMLDRLLETIRRNPEAFERMARENAQLREQVGKAALDNPELVRQIKERQRRGEDTQQMMETLDRARKAAAERPTSPEAGGGGPNNPQGPQPGSVDAGSGQPTPPSNPPRPPESDSGGDPQSPADEVQAERIREWARRLDRNLPDSMKNSDAVKRLADRFRQTDFKATGNKSILPERFRPNLDLKNRAGGAGNFFERNFGRLGNRGTPSMPNVHTPNMPRGPSLPTMGAPGAPSAGEVGGTFTVLMIVGGILAGAFLIWKLLVQPMQNAREKPKAWDPGSWPVNPTQIRTREELIKAFDHLALLNAGRQARHWHHLDVADSLGKPDPVRRVTANRLAQVYEHARYAPMEELLPESQIALARNDISSLAGATPS